MLTGTTGTGKTTLIRQVVAQAIERGDRCVLFDLTGHYMEAFYDPERDFVLNLNDARCESWSLFNDCHSRSELVTAATALLDRKSTRLNSSHKCPTRIPSSA